MPQADGCGIRGKEAAAADSCRVEQAADSGTRFTQRQPSKSADEGVGTTDRVRGRGLYLALSKGIFQGYSASAKLISCIQMQSDTWVSRADVPASGKSKCGW